MRRILIPVVVVIAVVASATMFGNARHAQTLAACACTPLNNSWTGNNTFTGGFTINVPGADFTRHPKILGNDPYNPSLTVQNDGNNNAIFAWSSATADGHALTAVSVSPTLSAIDARGSDSNLHVVFTASDNITENLRIYSDGTIEQRGAKWIVGSGAPSGACANGSLYTRNDAGGLFSCEGGAWVAK